jgi:hypothetical protein
MSLQLHFLQSKLDFVWEIWKQSMTNTVVGSIRIYLKWEKDTVAKGTQILVLNCWTLEWETSTDE